ncbi:MAG: hypothetical protein IT306_15545 [Chloroflexi bacterium]|nr:hypothetical protein [Chloroflexota bacterium]
MRLILPVTFSFGLPAWGANRRPALGPVEHVALERPANVARRLARVQAGIAVLVSVVVAVLALLAVSLPDEDRPAFALLLLLLTLSGLAMIALTDRWIGRSLDILVRSGSQARQSAAERAADLARVNGRLQRRDRERAELFATMSHELRTPLNAIIGHGRLLLDELDGDLNDEQRADVQQIYEGGRSLLKIVNGTLDFARLEAGAVEVVCEPVHPWPVAEEVAALLQPLADARGLRLTTSLSPSLPPVLADEERLRQVLVNLVGNAVKFTPTGSVELQASASADAVTLAVVDTGIGIPEEARARIFEPFRQVDGGMARAHDGTGLGLAISRQLVELMGGHLWVESNDGHGSRFLVSLPLAPAQPRLAADVPADRAPLAASQHVVLVSDDPAADALVAALADQGVRAARHTPDAWMRDRTSMLAPRCVLADVRGVQAGAWRLLQATASADATSDARIGLFGFSADGHRAFGHQAFGNVLMTPHLSVLPFAELERLLPDRLSAIPADDLALVVGADPLWRRQVSLLLQARGLTPYEVARGEAALTVARGEQVGAVVLDLVADSPGLPELLAELLAALGRRACPLVVVTPDALTPRQQHRLYLGALSWLTAGALPLPALAARIREHVTEPRRSHVAVGEY